MKRIKLLILPALVLFSVSLIFAISTQAASTSIKSIEISPSQTIITTQTKDFSSCEENIPSFLILPPTKQEGKAGTTLTYNLEVKNNDIGCARRGLDFINLMPYVPPKGKTINDCYGLNKECVWKALFIYSQNNKEYQQPNFMLDSQETLTLKTSLTSKENWPAGEYLHGLRLEWTAPGATKPGGHKVGYLDKYEIIYKLISDDKTCPDGCRCAGDVVNCPVKPVCQSPCTVSGNTCSCPIPETNKTTPLCKTGNEPWCSDVEETETKICKEGCVCKGDITTCPTAEAQEIQTPIGSNQKTVSIEKKQGSLSIKEGKATAITQEKLTIQDDNLYLGTSAGKKEIKISPEEASTKATLTKVSAIELIEESQAPIYSVKGTKQAKLFLLIPVSIQIETKVSAESGEVISVKKPWWSFLTR
ncbi:MAG: PepSY domain-containing protein [Patescibacteria group bacterium]